jgi:hypothetical protein
MSNAEIKKAYVTKYPNQFLLGDEDYTQFIVECTKKTDYVVDFRVYDSIHWAFGEDEPFEKELYLSCSIKWDGCSHFWFGEEEDGKPDGYLHICGLGSYYDHVKLMAYLYEKAFELMEREPLDDEHWDWEYLREVEE